MRILLKLACWLGLHRPPDGVNREWSIAWVCRCGALVPGDLVRRR